jgi:hypothetical protein
VMGQTSQTVSERLFEEFCETHGVPCVPIPRATKRTPDYEIQIDGLSVVCEIKQIDRNDEDIAELKEIDSGQIAPVGRQLPNRIRGLLKHGASAQLRDASGLGRPTLLVIYDNTRFQIYTHHDDVVEAMFGRNSVRVTNGHAEPQVSQPFFGGDKGLGVDRNTSLSAIAILDGGTRPLQLRVYRNPYARIRMDRSLFQSIAVTYGEDANA